MLNLLRKLTGVAGPEKGAAAEPDRIQVAACVLLLEMAHTDGEFHAMEATLVKDLLADKFQLSAEATAELIALAQQEREASLDIYQFTRQIDANFSLEQKLEVIESLWRIVYVDGVLDKYEEYLMRQLAKLLHISHRQMIEAKLKVLAEQRASS
ncbi:hypothetical protein DESUT3_29530 [Desulfuromonas versatilis]|uniref:Co-chaperone DjlA N-terminal domain-containing protein n=1 Tax=Desulfuromonas versatilis TaxID=2802975 RepID=A0ABM8HYT8_9BACT|nr:TerB family tellurite resistance protein [Desulfuromonas versatilis]BCR05884.1 hypothetical protein DESUT3_29530 [Desulfuromonas versatilis]